MGLCSFPVSCLTRGNPVLESIGFMVGLRAPSKRTHAKMHLPKLPSIFPSIRVLPCQFPHPRGRPLPTHISAGDLQTLTARSDSVSCGAAAPSPWVLVYTRFRLCSPRVEPSVSSSPLEVLQSNPAGLQSQIPWRCPVPLQDHQTGKILVLSQEKMNTCLSTLPSGTNLSSCYMFLR